jgi:hypothetical protein
MASEGSRRRGERIEDLRCVAPIELVDSGTEKVHRGVLFLPPSQNAPARVSFSSVMTVPSSSVDLTSFITIWPPISSSRALRCSGSPGSGKRGGQQGRPAGGQGTTGRPDVERGDVAVTDVLLVNAGQGSLL